MKIPLTRPETGLLLALALAAALACLAPAVAQYADYHAFADKRTLWGMPYAMDVLSNLPFAVMGVWGLLRLRHMRTPEARCTGFAAWVPCDAQRQLAQLFFGGLLLTALCSSYYHLQPNNFGLAIDRMGMLAAFVPQVRIRQEVCARLAEKVILVSLIFAVSSLLSYC